MEALGALSPIEEARARLQEKIGEFFTSRARLVRLLNNQSLQIQGQARSLYAAQASIEDQIYKEVMPRIQKVQSGTWDFSDIAMLGSYTSMIINQIDSVNKLERQAGATVSQPWMSNETSVIVMPALLVGGLMLGYVVFNK
jgi:hypothetical protein